MVEIIHSKEYSKKELISFITNELSENLQASIKESERCVTIEIEKGG